MRYLILKNRTVRLIDLNTCLCTQILIFSVSYLVLGRVEGEIPNIQSVALLQQLLLFIAVTLKTHAAPLI